MSEENLNKNLKYLAIITLVLIIAYVILQIGSYFMNLVTLFGIAIVLTYVLIEPVNILERFLERYLPPFEFKSHSSTIKMKDIALNIPEIVININKRVFSIVTVYVFFLLLVIIMAIKLIPPAIVQVTEFAKNVPVYAGVIGDTIGDSINYINKKFPQLEMQGLFDGYSDNTTKLDYLKESNPTIIHEIPDNSDTINIYKENQPSTEESTLSSNKISKAQVEKAAIQIAVQFKDSIIAFIQNNAQGAINNLLSVAVGTLTGIGYTLTIFVLSFYFLLDGKNLINNINSFFPKSSLPKLIELENSIHNSLLGFLKGQVFLGILTGLVMLPIYLSFGVNYALFLCIFLAVAEIIPVIGSSIGFVPAVIVILFTNPINLIIVGFLFWLLQTIKDNIIAPKIVGEIIGLHPVTVIFALWIGFQVAGFFGILFAIPVASVINVIISFIIKDNPENKETVPVS